MSVGDGSSALPCSLSCTKLIFSGLFMGLSVLKEAHRFLYFRGSAGAEVRVSAIK